MSKRQGAAILRFRSVTFPYRRRFCLLDICRPGFHRFSEYRRTARFFVGDRMIPSEDAPPRFDVAAGHSGKLPPSRPLEEVLDPFIYWFKCPKIRHLTAGTKAFRDHSGVQQSSCQTNLRFWVRPLAQIMPNRLKTRTLEGCDLAQNPRAANAFSQFKRGGGKMFTTFCPRIR